MNKNELKVILNFLKSGFSTRQLDKLWGHKGTKGLKVIRLFEHSLKRKHLNTSCSIIKRELRKRGYIEWHV